MDCSVWPQLPASLSERTPTWHKHWNCFSSMTHTHTLMCKYLDRVNHSESPCGVQMCFFLNFPHVSGVVVPLRKLTSTGNVVNNIPYIPAYLKFSDKRQSIPWAGRLVNVCHRWDFTWMECRGPATVCESNFWPFHPAIRKQVFLCLKFDAIGYCLWADLGSEHSRGTHPVLMYVDVRSKHYLVEA